MQVGKFVQITNPFISFLGSGKTITTIHQSIKALTRNKDAICLTNVTLKNFPKNLQDRIIKYNVFIEVEDYIKENPKQYKIVLLDEAQNEFDKRLHGNKAQIHRTYFLNFFRKFNIELYFNYVNRNRGEFRLDDLCTEIYYPFMQKNNYCYVYDVYYLGHYLFNAQYYFNKYDTEEYIAPSFEQTSNYIVKQLANDSMFHKLIQLGDKKSNLENHIRLKYHVSKEEASLIYAYYVAGGQEQ